MMGLATEIHDRGDESHIDTVEKIAMAFLTFLIGIAYAA